MKRIFIFLFALVMVIGFYVQAQANLIDRGPDSLGYHLIYDTDLNITWYDFVVNDEWEHMSDYMHYIEHAQGSLMRLPITKSGPIDLDLIDQGNINPDDYPILSSELGHLFSTELIDGPEPFKNLRPGSYWSSIVNTIPNSEAWAWYYEYPGGNPGIDWADTITRNALFVLDGDVGAKIPEPSTMLLLGSGLICLAGYGRKKFFKK